MREVVKYYNYHDFDLKMKEESVAKNLLSVKEFSNLDIYSKNIKPVSGFKNLLSGLLFNGNQVDEDLFYEQVKEQDRILLENLIYLTAYDYYDDQSENYKTIYFGLDKDFNLYKLFYSSKTGESGEGFDFLAQEQNIKFSKMPRVFCENGKIYFYESSRQFVYFENNFDATIISNFTNILSYCNHYDMTFFVSDNSPFKLFYLDKTDVENIGDDLSLYSSVDTDSNNGKILKVVSFKNNIYVISQYAVSKLVLVDDQYFLVSNCYISSKIEEETIFKVNDYLVFFAGKKCYIFDGNEFKEIFSNETESVKLNSSKKVVVFDNKYFVLTDYCLGENTERVILELDIFKMKSKIYSAGNITDIYKIKSMNSYKLVAVRYLENAGKFELLEKIEGEIISGRKYVKFNTICFDDNASKVLSEIKTVSSGNFVIKITSEIGQRVFDVSGALCVSSLGLRGYGFDIEVFSDDDFILKSILFKIQTISE